MKSFKLLALLFCIYNNLYSQSTPNKWVIGTGSTGFSSNNILDFSLGKLDTINPNPNPQVRFSFTSAAIGDKDSNLLYYTNGTSIFNKTNSVIQNGDTLSPCPYTIWAMTHGMYLSQITVFIPDPADTNLFYLFHASGDINYQPCPSLGGGAAPNKFYYTIIDKTLDNGNGGVFSKNNILVNDSIGQGIMAPKHGNGKDWWIIVRHAVKPQWISWLVTTTGIAGPYYQNIGTTTCGGYHSLKFSPLTNKVVGFKSYFDWPATRYIDLFDFDRCSGLFSNPETITINHYMNSILSGGCGLSPSGRYLYAGVYNVLYQYDMLASNIQASQILVDSIDSISMLYQKCTWGGMQAGPDGKLYANTFNSSTYYLGVINFPDSAGIACNAVHGGIVLPNYHFNDLPNIPLYELGPLVGSGCDMELQE